MFTNILRKFFGACIHKKFTKKISLNTKSWTIVYIFWIDQNLFRKFLNTHPLKNLRKRFHVHFKYVHTVVDLSDVDYDSPADKELDRVDLTADDSPSLRRNRHVTKDQEDREGPGRQNPGDQGMVQRLPPYRQTKSV